MNRALHATMLSVSLLSISVLVACDNPAPGEPCEVTGDGFTRQDPCADTCVEWDVECPDGSTLAPSVCTDGPCSSDADCESGWLCLQIDMTDSECLPADICPSASGEYGGEDDLPPIMESLVAPAG